MSEPKRLIHDDDAGPERPVLNAALEAPPHGYVPSEAKWQEVNARARAGAWKAWRSVALATAGALAVTALSIVVVRNVSGPVAVDLGNAVAVVGAEPVDAERRGDEIMLHRGKLKGQPAAVLTRMLTPHLSVAWKAARFLAFVSDDRTVLSVEEGYVVARQGAQERVVAQGEQLFASPGGFSQGGSELVPGALKSLPSLKQERCRQLANEVELQRCLGEVAAGSDLAAQNALFELALQGRGSGNDLAVRRWREYLTRFPDGALAPEAQVGITIELCSSGRLPEALDEARGYLSKWGDEPSASQMVELKGRLEQWLRPPKQQP